MSDRNLIVGIDPGATTGYCVYDQNANRVVEAGAFAGHDFGGTGLDLTLHGAERNRVRAIVVERPKGYGPTRPQLVDCGYVAGRLVERLSMQGPCGVDELLRLDVCKILTALTDGAIRVRNDATAWAALLLLFGDGSDRKAKTKKGVGVEPAGAIGIVAGHARAALAVAVAWSMRGAR